MTDRLAKFGPIWGASGVQGFFGEGYPPHRYLKFFGLTFDGLTLTAKTTTAQSNKGNMPMEKDGITPQEFLPRCVYVSPRSWLYGSALNAVALSGPGINSLIEMGEWQKQTRPFFISIMAIGKTVQEKNLEMSTFQVYIASLLKWWPFLQDLLGVQINYSCPNTGENMEEMLQELVGQSQRDMNMLGMLGLPLVPKISVLFPVEYAQEIGNDRYCAGLTLSNTIPWDDLPKFGIDRRKIFGSDVSPLIKRGFKQPGGYSGKELLPHVAHYVRELRAAGFRKHINAGGGILGPSDIDVLYDSGANSFSLGSIAFLRCWRMRATIARAYKLCAR
ncbi:MAG: hypothetical protein A3A96_01510 [Candidatus Zambryskibacteria bacterium RIFCSPLOWO2_01_FULL_39_39]|uniref:Dihydroorotate dehydrogenase domain-containing protein n=1 Tax=Candidatus Zambryskibacteria bacterium RIFCSPLOWO2_01_FULL_39_39 TaxID=1802758 RepID=A0A1G2TZR5_9BACT|nr:MAG: hypothetical protein A2644_03110 [Candidatus Zambryskibacteria bacterium RIFCSPHIGHO2_01_FULL_39_63]OHA95237.1 MAG: hypothetical protein A3B88_02880 [Candidatus Zambryskibacteria bacterium RIFCSPHIGHO2_02_FULL_39_19]OHA98831.1 MAG: hypothetical protein A3F20_02150 [Candidatus Zambryskibacteria bacterium RIFCSPHIGHO2_12_FULL_39_21]OHB02798.1 MAG: hypothetical protein A3A96_01510 [Candidatus Zambryskibacteria bacterium RIFCSPLOWO2_01_FULL_39_39]